MAGLRQIADCGGGFYIIRKFSKFGSLNISSLLGRRIPAANIVKITAEGKDKFANGPEKPVSGGKIAGENDGQRLYNLTAADFCIFW
jgi:hypothetical protein